MRNYQTALINAVFATVGTSLILWIGSKILINSVIKAFS